MKDQTHKRHIAKAITWRIVGTITTILLAWLISGKITTGFQIGGIETITKLILYYLHERMWFNVNLDKYVLFKNSRVRHLTKAFSWRLIGTIETILLSWIITGNPYVGLQIGFADVTIKMLLYYLHERTWHKIDYGLNEEEINVKNKKYE